MVVYQNCMYICICIYLPIYIKSAIYVRLRSYMYIYQNSQATTWDYCCFFLYLYQNISLAKISLVFCFDRIKFQAIAIATEYKTNLATFITLNQCRMLKEGRNVENV